MRLIHRKVHARDLADCETKTGMPEREIELDGSLDKAPRERLLDIANKCPVHRTLNSEIRIETRLREDTGH